MPPPQINSKAYIFNLHSLRLEFLPVITATEACNWGNLFPGAHPHSSLPSDFKFLYFQTGINYHLKDA